MIDLGWMAWTWETTAFFAAIGTALLAMIAWEIAAPGGAPRDGILGLRTTRGDRLFVSLLGSAFIHLGWLWLVGPGLPYASALSLLYAAAVFRWV